MLAHYLFGEALLTVFLRSPGKGLQLYSVSGGKSVGHILGLSSDFRQYPRVFRKGIDPIFVMMNEQVPPYGV